jgi:uncharacterized iron-regulated membrane protein
MLVYYARRMKRDFKSHFDVVQELHSNLTLMLYKSYTRHLLRLVSAVGLQALSSGLLLLRRRRHDIRGGPGPRAADGAL